jgi:hypothetical protein
MRSTPLLCALLTSGCGRQQPSPQPPAPDPEPSAPVECGDYDTLGHVYWGDLHIHTSWSLDSYTTGNRNDPADAYAFARGQTLPIADGDGGTETATIDRPLDFAAVTEHSEFLSMTGQCLLGEPGGEAACAALTDQGSAGQNALSSQAALQLVRPDPSDMAQCLGPGNEEQCAAATVAAWEKLQEVTEAAYDPCEFTTLHAFEWTAMTGGANLHRNVIFRTNQVPDAPLDYLRYPTALELWRGLDRQCLSEDGCEAITIPHNANFSTGMMWETAEDPEARAYMARYQILVEIFQHKGSSECLVGGGLEDPSCEFETANGNLLAAIFGADANDADPATAGRGYIRNGLARGLELAMFEQNPLEMGFIGSTDTHNGTPGRVKEEGWPGHVGNEDFTPDLRLTELPKLNPGGITGVWAPQNTRDAIYDALARRETFATSGPRMIVRFYAKDGLANDEEAAAYCADPMFPSNLLQDGATPMGGRAPSGGAPYLFVSVLKDEVDLDSIDIVKLSLDEAGQGQVSLQELPLSDEQRSSACVFWKDPSYAAGPSLYYARVFQQPTWRWSHYDCEVDPTSCAASEIDADVQVQERAWTSPIFFGTGP